MIHLPYFPHLCWVGINYNQSLHSQGLQPTVPKCAWRCPLCPPASPVAPPQTHCGDISGPLRGLRGQKMPASLQGFSFFFIKAVTPKTSWDLSPNTSCEFSKVVNTQLRIDRGGYSAFWTICSSKGGCYLSVLALYSVLGPQEKFRNMWDTFRLTCHSFGRKRERCITFWEDPYMGTWL